MKMKKMLAILVLVLLLMIAIGGPNGFAGEFEGDVKISGDGSGIVFPDGTKQTTAGGGSGGFLCPAYDSGWVVFPEYRGTIELVHSLGGDPNNYLVDLQFYYMSIEIPWGIHNLGHGGDQYYPYSDRYGRGAYYRELDEQSITLVNCDWPSGVSTTVRVRIWVCDPNDFAGESGSDADSDWIISGNNMYSGVTGNVGIGTSSPSSKLEVNGLIKARGLTGNASILDIESVDDITLKIDSTKGPVYSFLELFNGEGELLWWVNEGGNMRVSGYATVDGNFGIGTWIPEHELDVRGYVTRIKSPGNAQIWVEAGGTGSSTLKLQDASDPSPSGWQIIALQTNHNLRFHHGGPKVEITSDGKVGIGTTDPKGKLDVNGSIYQRGNVLHADYVFEPSYELESIEEHSEYMWQHKHLAAIPKAVVDDNGQEIVEVGAHRKGVVEELEKAHIYIDQLHMRVKALEERLLELERGRDAGKD